MKLFEAGSVFLIIGSAVVGPIEGQKTQYFPIDPNRTLWEGCVPSIPGDCRVVPPETDEQICERIMREIGANQIADRKTLERDFPKGNWDKRFPPESWWIFKGGQHQVLCIPAPSGLK